MSLSDPTQPPPGTIAYVPGMDIISGQSYWFPPGTAPPAHLLFTDNPPPVAARVSAAGRRLYWTLQGPLASPGVVSVMPADLNPDAPREAFVGGIEDGDSRHSISEESVTERPVASITVHEENLKDWRDEWYTINQEGFDEDVQPDEADMPPEVEPLVVTASNGVAVTVYDYVAAVHPWLMAHREQILMAQNVADEEYTPVGNERLVVDMENPELVRADDEDELTQVLRLRFESGGGGQQGQ